MAGSNSATIRTTSMLDAPMFRAALLRRAAGVTTLGNNAQGQVPVGEHSNGMPLTVADDKRSDVAGVHSTCGGLDWFIWVRQIDFPYANLSHRHDSLRFGHLTSITGHWQRIDT
jgi:hypothetical protein